MRPITMLIWSQWRQVRWFVAATFAISMLLALGSRMLTPSDAAFDAKQMLLAFSYVSLYCGLIATAARSVFFHNDLSAFRLGFPRHLSLLPVSTRTAAACHVIFSVATLVLLFAVTETAVTYLVSEPLETELGESFFLLSSLLLLAFACIWAGATHVGWAASLLGTTTLIVFLMLPPKAATIAICAGSILLLAAGARLGRANRLPSFRVGLRWPLKYSNRLAGMDPRMAASWFETKTRASLFGRLYFAVLAFNTLAVIIGKQLWGLNWHSVSRLFQEADVIVLQSLLISAIGFNFWTFFTDFHQSRRRAHASMSVLPVTERTLAVARLLSHGQALVLPVFVTTVVLAIRSRSVGAGVRLENVFDGVLKPFLIDISHMQTPSTLLYLLYVTVLFLNLLSIAWVLTQGAGLIFLLFLAANAISYAIHGQWPSAIDFAIACFTLTSIVFLGFAIMEKWRRSDWFNMAAIALVVLGSQLPNNDFAFAPSNSAIPAYILAILCIVPLCTTPMIARWQRHRA